VHARQTVSCKSRSKGKILTLSPSLLPKQLQVVLFSATFPEAVVRYAEKFAPSADQLTLKQEELTVDGIKQLYMDCASEADKYDVLVKLYGLMTIGSSIIFVKVGNVATVVTQHAHRFVAPRHRR
jgi:ATP-dependent RNA helicase DDX19/DBP5